MTRYYQTLRGAYILFTGHEKCKKPPKSDYTLCFRPKIRGEITENELLCQILTKFDAVICFGVNSFYIEFSAYSTHLFLCYYMFCVADALFTLKAHKT